MKELIKDSNFRVELVAQTPNPQTVCYVHAKNDYSEEFIMDKEWPSEDKCGEFLVKKILPVGHFGVLEGPAMTLAFGGFPHSAMMQLRTHRTGCSFDYTSFRYSGRRIIKVAKGDLSVESIFYVRPVGEYTDRQGKRYEFTDELRERHLLKCYDSAVQYRSDIESGLSEEHARGLIVHDTRQNGVISANLRSWWHFMSLRMPADVQLECRTAMYMAYPHLENWTPELMEWHSRRLKGKSKLAP